MDIMEKIPGILADHPLAQNIVLHVGGNDIHKQISEILKHDYTKLLESLTVQSRRIFVSGPLPHFIAAWATSAVLSVSFLG